MELLKGQDKIKLINQFMLELEDTFHELSKTEIYRKYESTLKDVKPFDIFDLNMYQDDTSFSIEEI
ncbi:MAG: hypothetical protein KJ847_04535, partial [Firmicutes bacterium]|nr:hypothetical protein [Bacillota bacterium]